MLGIWAAILMAGLLFVAAASLRLAVRLRKAEKVKPGEIPRIPGIDDVTVLKTDGIAMPITAAFLPGRIYVPAAWDGWTRECRRMVLLHEMAHLRRRDGAVLILQIIAKAFYFFHPLVHLLDRRISEYREMACDDATVGRDRDSSVEYSRYLVEIAESVVRCPAVCGSASALIRRKNELLKRVSYQLEEGRMHSIPRTRLIALTAAIVLMAVSLSWYRGEASAVDQSKAPSPPDRPAPAERPAPPAPPAQPSPEDGSRVRPISVLLRSDGAEIDDKKVSMDELAAALDIYGGRDPGSVWVRLVCDDDVPMSDIRFFQDLLTTQGISKISYMNSDGEGLPLQLPPQKALDRLAEMPGDMLIDVSVCAGGLMKVGARNVTTGDLAQVIADELTKRPLAVVVIHNEEKTSYGDFTKALELVKKAGAERVVVRFDGVK
jgi:biopolymer transport protein ExbD